MNKTNIPWTDYSWNPSIGCELPLASSGCKFCYARELHNMRHKAYLAGKKLPIQYAKPFEEIQLFPDRLEDPLRKKKPCKIFVGSMTDLFCPSVPFEFLAKVFYQISICYWHTFQILTKRPERVLDFYAWIREQKKGFWWEEFAVLAAHLPMDRGEAIAEPYLTYHANAKKHYYSGIPEPVKKLGDAGIFVPWPPPNLWLGVTAENQKEADKRIPILLQIPAAKRFVSVEPMLEQIDIPLPHNRKYHELNGPCTCPKPDWCIIGCESGPKRRPCNIEWVRDLVNQCKAAGVAPFVKQVPINGKVVKDITKFPKDLQYQEYPE